MIKALIFLLLSLGVLSHSEAQSFSIGHRQVNFIDPERDNRPILTEIYYPADSAGDNVPVSGQAGDAYPVLAFGHGFVMEWSAYANIWNTLVQQGYIIAFPRTETGISPDHETFGRDLAYIIRAIREEGNTAGSPFFEWVDSTSCVMGHSMGGGASFLAVQYNPDITAIVNLAAAETNPSAIKACADIDIPALVFAGGNDCVTPPESNQILMYDSLSSDCKTLVRIKGASHCQFAQQNVFCSFGELTCNPAPDISRAEQHRMVDTLLVPWLDYHLKGNCQASLELQNILLGTSNNWTALQDCEPCITVSAYEVEKSPSFQVYPMPSPGEFYLKGPSGIKQLTVSVYNVDGILVYHKDIEDHKNGVWGINAGLMPGVYTITIGNHGQVEALKLIIQ